MLRNSVRINEENVIVTIFKNEFSNKYKLKAIIKTPYYI